MNIKNIQKFVISFILIITMTVSSLIASYAISYHEMKKNPDYHYGVDVSLWNDDLDWEVLRNEGVEFAYIRVGYYDNYGGHLDKRFKQNVIGCVENGIEFGVYVYSYVYSIKDNENCAKWIHKELKNMGNYCKDKDTIQVAYDIEDGVQLNALTSGRISKDYMQRSVEKFCYTVKDLGYIPTVYSFSSFFRDFLDVEKLQKSDVKIWVANWKNLNYTNIYDKKKIDGYYTDIWQYGCTLKIAGTVFDTNVCYDDFYDYKNENSKLTVKNLNSFYTYTGKEIKPKIKVYSNDKLLKENKDYKLIYFNNKLQGEARIKIIRYVNKKYLETKTVTFKIWNDKINVLNSTSYKTKIKLKWDEIENADFYQIYFYDEPVGRFNLLEETELNDSVISTLDRNKKYTFKIRAVREYENLTCFGKFKKVVCSTK